MEILIIKDTDVLARCYSHEEVKEEVIRISGASLELRSELDPDCPYPNGFTYELCLYGVGTGRKYYTHSMDPADKAALWDVILRSEWFMKKCNLQLFTKYTY
jgi:hypothetical protein